MRANPEYAINKKDQDLVEEEPSGNSDIENHASVDINNTQLDTLESRC